MTGKSSRHSIFAGIGCMSLLAYVIACQQASFSPDDSQVLYPAFDPASGAESVAVYDRQASRSEAIFTALPGEQAGSRHEGGLIRAQWLPDGKHVLIAQAQPNHDNQIAFLVLPRGVSDPVRDLGSIELTNKDSALNVLLYPLCVVGSKVYVCDEKKITRLDLVTGQSGSFETTNAVCLLPGGGGTQIVGAVDQSKGESPDGKGMTLGVFDPQTLAFRPMLTLTNELSEGVFPAFDPRTRQAVFVTGADTNLQLQVTTNGNVTFSRTLARGTAKQQLGPWLDLGPRRDRVFTAYCTQEEKAPNAEYGVVEIPLNDEPLRWIPLFRAEEARDARLLYTQGSLSHDGKTWAMASSSMPGQSLKPEDRALYLVDFSIPKPKITKVPVTLPAGSAVPNDK